MVVYLFNPSAVLPTSWLGWNTSEQDAVHLSVIPSCVLWVTGLRGPLWLIMLHADLYFVQTQLARNLSHIMGSFDLDWNLHFAMLKKICNLSRSSSSSSSCCLLKFCSVKAPDCETDSSCTPISSQRRQHLAPKRKWPCYNSHFRGNLEQLCHFTVCRLHWKKKTCVIITYHMCYCINASNPRTGFTIFTQHVTSQAFAYSINLRSCQTGEGSVEWLKVSCHET